MLWPERYGADDCCGKAPYKKLTKLVFTESR
jgi:hypothetical protein